jgi:hypothetical protein
MNTDPHSPFVSRVGCAPMTARIAVLVDADGRVLDAHVDGAGGGAPENLILAGALVAALRRFHFQPARTAGSARRGWSTVECALQLGPQAGSDPAGFSTA